MPLESRLTRKPVSVAQAAEAAGQEANISPRRRGLSTAAAAADAKPEPRQDDLDREAAIDAAVDAFVGADPGIEAGDTQHGGEPPAEEEEEAKTADAEINRRTAEMLATATPAPKLRKTRQPRQAKAKPEGSPESLREQLKEIEGQLKALKQDYQTNAAPLVARYKDVSAALADSLLG